MAIVLTMLAAPLAACGDDDAASTDTDADTTAGDDAPTSTVDPTTTNPTDPDTSSTGVSATDPTTEDSTTAVEASLLERVIEALGGQTSLDALVGVQLEVSGSRWVSDEGVEPTDDPLPGSDYTATVSIDIDDAGLRLDYDRTITFAGLGLPLSYSEIVAGQLGRTDGIDSLFMFPPGAMPSDRWASTVRQQRLFNPQVLVKEAAADPSIATEAGAEEYDGRPHELLELADPVHPLTLWVDRETGLVSRLTTMENNYLRRDIEIELVYEQWEASDGGVLFPQHVVLHVDGHTIADETRTSVTTEVELGAELFEIPEDVGATYDEALAERGARNHQWSQEFVSAGLPNSGLQTFAQGGEVAPGVWWVTGGSHHSVVVEQDGGLVLFETPLYEPRCLAVLDWIDANLGGQPVTHAVVSHFHVDHASCARTLVARGATLVVGEGSDVVWTDVLMAPSTVEPDELEANPVADPQVEYVPNDGSFTIDDSTRPVTVYDLPNWHSDDMVLPFVEGAGVAFVADLFNTGTLDQLFGAAGAQAVLDAIEQHGITGSVDIVVGAHGGGTSTIADLQTVAGG